MSVIMKFAGDFYGELEARGLIHQVTDPLLRDYLSQNKVTVYVGFDPTADSLHIGNLLPLVTLKRFQKAGHSVIAIAGGATGMIGDPSGKSQERQLLNAERLQKNVDGISKIISQFVRDEAGEGKTRFLNNYDWFKDISLIDFLRDTGKHFTVNYMISKESVRARLEDREHGISFTEFCYMLLQGYDFHHLYRQHQCRLQLGGADQWGNITAGIELIRRMNAFEQRPAEAVFGLTWPLVTKSDGTKFGKTESGAVWLSADKTSPYEFYQFFLQVADQDVIRFLKFFTFLTLDQIQELEQSLKTQPEKRLAQNELAKELTILVHGEAEYERVKKASAAFFSTEIQSLDEASLKQLTANTPSTSLLKKDLQSGISLIDLLVQSKLVSSKGQARQEIQGGGIYINNQRVSDISLTLTPENLIAGKFLILRKGKKNYHSVVFE